MLLRLLRILPGWNSIYVTGQIHERLGRFERIALLMMFVAELLAWKFLEAHHWFEFGGIMALGALWLLEHISSEYGKRSEELKDEKHKSEMKQLYADAAESAMTTDFVSGRALSDEAKAILKDRLSKHAPQKFLIVTKASNAEGIEFGEIIREFLRDGCGWMPERHIMDGRVTDEVRAIFSTDLGIGITVAPSGMDFAAHREGRPSTIPVLYELTDALNDANVLLFRLRAQSMGELTMGVVGILIGVKP